jgi:hypothetical protein
LAAWGLAVDAELVRAKGFQYDTRTIQKHVREWMLDALGPEEAPVSMLKSVLAAIDLKELDRLIKAVQAKPNGYKVIDDAIKFCKANAKR